MGRPVCPAWRVPRHPHHQFHPPFPQYKKQDSPSRQRHRARRSAAQQAGAEKELTEEVAVEESVLNDNNRKERNSEARNVEETEGNANYISESTDNFDQNDETIVTADTAEEASKAMIVPEELTMKNMKKQKVLMKKSLFVV